MNKVIIKFWFLLLAYSALAQNNPFTRAEIETEKAVIVGQPVILSVQVFVPSWFTSAPEFPELNVPNAIVTPPGQSLNLNERIEGQSYAGIQKEYTIYPQIPGEFQIESFNIIVRYALENAQPSMPAPVKVAVTNFMARLPKEAEGLPYFISTKSLTIRQTIDPEEDTLKVGDVLERKISVTVRDALSMVIPPLSLGAPAGLAAYPASPMVTDKGGERGEQYVGSRLESVTYVMQKEGTYELPAIEISWYDLSATKLRSSTVPAVKFNVIANPGFSAEFPMKTDSTILETEVIIQEKNDLVYFLLVALLVLGIFFWLFLRYRKSLRVWYVAAEHRRRESEAAYFNRFRQACRKNNVPAIMNSLLAWLDKTGEFPGAATTALLITKAADPELTVVINDLKERLYGPKQPVPKNWASKRLLIAVNNFRRNQKRKLITNKALAPLNPID